MFSGQAMTIQHPNFIQSYFHGTKADLKAGDLVVPGNNANYGFKVVAEVKAWQGHPAEEIAAAREEVALALRNGAPIIED